MKDKLDLLFEKQKSLMNRYAELGYLPNPPIDLDLGKKENVRVVRDCVFHITQELFEAIYHLKNRPDRKTEITEINRKEYEEELIDGLHLYLELLLLSGLNSESVFKLYADKNQKNHERIDNNY